jgi:hypothetical protein
VPIAGAWRVARVATASPDDPHGITGEFASDQTGVRLELDGLICDLSAGVEVSPAHARVDEVVAMVLVIDVRPRRDDRRRTRLTVARNTCMVGM